MKNQHNNKNTESITNYLQYFEAKLQKTSLISNQHKNVCGQLIMDYLKNIGCNDKVLTDLNTILFPNNHSQKVNQSLTHPLQSLVQEKYGNSIENQLSDAISHLYKPKQRQRIPHHERIKQHSLNYANGQEYQLPDQIRRLKTCFGHALHPDNQDQEDPYIPIYNILYDKSGQLLITGDDMGLIKIWSSSTGLLLQSLKGHTMAINSMDISHCNKYLATCSNDGLVLLWEIQSAKPIAAIKDFQDDPILVLLFLYIDDEKNYLYVATEKGYLYIYRFEDLVACNGGMLGTQFNTKSRKSSITHYADVVRVSGKKQNGILCMEFNKQGYLVIGTEQGEILIWESPDQLVDGELNHIIWKEHIKECHLAKWNTRGDMLMTASFDGTAKLWNWHQEGLDKNINNKSYVTMKYKNKSRRVGETSCLAIAWSCRNSYALASFSKKLKQRGDEENARTQIQVYDLIENKIISFLDGEQFWPGLMDYPIFILEAHPHDEQIALSADQNGFIIIWNIVEQEILKIFHERGYHMKLPNLEVPLLDGCFSPNGLQFVVSSDFGSFSIYGYGASEIYEQTPVEQFFVSDSIHPIIDDTHGFKIMSLDSDMEFCYVDRGNICNFYRMPYQYTFHNNYKAFCQFLYQPDYIAKKSTNIQRPRIQHFLTTSREVQQDNRKNDEMFYNSLQELKEKEIKIYENIKNYNDFKENEKYQQLYTDIQDLFKDKTTKQTQQIESDKEHSSGSGGGKLIKKIKQKDEQMSNHNNNQYEEQSSFISQFIEDRKITRGRKVIDSDDEYDKKEQRSPEPQVRTTRLRFRDQQQRLNTLNNHRQIRNQDLRRNNRSSNQEICHRCKQQITDGAIKCSECRKGYHKDCAERHLYLSEGDVVKKFCLNCICQSYKKKIVSKNYLTQAQREQYLEDNTNLPQIGDMIIFFLKGYEQFLQKNLFQLDLTHLQDDGQIIIYPGDKLKDNVFQVTFKVTNIVYIFPTQNNQYKQKSNGQQQSIQQLVFLENDEMSMRCFYTFDSDQFLLLESIFNHSLKCIKPLLQPNVLIQTDQDRDQDIPHQYVFLSFEQQNQDDWQTVQCRKINDESYQTRKNTQQTINIHMWDIATIINQSKSNKVVEIQAVQLQSALYPYESKQIIQEILNYMKKVVGLNYYFQEPVDVNIYQDYNAFVPLGSFIRLVKRRLESCFYRSKEHIMNDILRMRDNAFLFNAPESEVCILVEQFYSQLQMIVYSDYVEQQTEIQLRKRRR